MVPIITGTILVRIKPFCIVQWERINIVLVPVVVVVGIGIVAHPIFIRVHPLVGIQGEGIRCIIISVAIIVTVSFVASAISVRINPFNIIKWKLIVLNSQIVYAVIVVISISLQPDDKIQDIVIIVIHILIISLSIAIRVHPFGSVMREFVILTTVIHSIVVRISIPPQSRSNIGNPIVVIIMICEIPNKIVIKIQIFCGIGWQQVLIIRNPIEIVIQGQLVDLECPATGGQNVWI